MSAPADEIARMFEAQNIPVSVLNDAPNRDVERDTPLQAIAKFAVFVAMVLMIGWWL